MTVNGESIPIKTGYWINFIPNINISTNDIIDKITPFLGIWEVSSNHPLPDTLSDTRVFIRELNEDNLNTSEWYPVYKRNNEEFNNQDILRMFYSYWIFSIQDLSSIQVDPNFRPYYNQLFRSLNFRQHLRDSPDSSSVSLVLFDNFASTILDVSGNKIDYYTFDRLSNYNMDISNHSIASSDLYINNIFALFIQDDVTDINITNFYQSNILQTNSLQIESINLSNLRVLHFHETSQCRTISKNSFNSSLGNLQQLILPDSIETIDDFAFRNSGRLNFVLIPNNITTLGEGCFHDCSSLRIINFDYDVSNLKIIPKNFCKGNTSLNSCILPGSVTDICDSAFENCKELTHFEFTSIDSIRHIGEAAFRGSGIQRISRVEDDSFFVGVSTISGDNDESLEEIGIEAFARCGRLQLANLSSFSNLKALSERVFLDSSSLISVYLPSKVERIYESAFQGCSSLNYLFYNLTNSFFEDMRIQVAFFNATTSDINNNSSFNNISNGNPFHYFWNRNIFITQGSYLEQRFEDISPEKFPNFLSIIESDAFNGTIFNTIIIPSSCRTLSRNCFRGSNISRIIFLGSLPQPLSSIFLYNFESINTTEYGSPFLDHDIYLSSVFKRIFPDLDNGHNYYNFPIKEIIYFSNLSNGSTRDRSTAKLPWNRNNPSNTRIYFNITNDKDEPIARINFHEIDVNTISVPDNSNTSLFGNIPINESMIQGLSSIYHLTINNSIQSINNNEIAHLYRPQRFQSYYLNLSFNNSVLMSLINNFDNDTETNLSTSRELDSIVRLIVKFDSPYYFNIHNHDPSLSMYDLSFSIHPDKLKENLLPGATYISNWPPYLRPLACDSSYGPYNQTNITDDDSIIIYADVQGYLWSTYIFYCGLSARRADVENSFLEWQVGPSLRHLQQIYTDFSGINIRRNSEIFSYEHLLDNSRRYAHAIQANNVNGVGQRLTWFEFRNFYLHEQQNYLQLRNRFIRIIQSKDSVRYAVRGILSSISLPTSRTDELEKELTLVPITNNLGEYIDPSNLILNTSTSFYGMNPRFTIENDHIFVLHHDGSYNIRIAKLNEAISSNISNWKNIRMTNPFPITQVVVGTGITARSERIWYGQPELSGNEWTKGKLLFYIYNDNNVRQRFRAGALQGGGSLVATSRLLILKRGPDRNDVLLHNQDGAFTNLIRDQPGFDDENSEADPIYFSNQPNNITYDIPSGVVQNFTNNKHFGFASHVITSRILCLRRNYYEANDINELTFINSNVTEIILKINPRGTILQLECDDENLYILSDLNLGTIFRVNMQIIRDGFIPDSYFINFTHPIQSGHNLYESNNEINIEVDKCVVVGTHLLRRDREPVEGEDIRINPMVLYQGEIYLEKDNSICRLNQGYNWMSLLSPSNLRRISSNLGVYSDNDNVINNNQPTFSYHYILDNRFSIHDGKIYVLTIDRDDTGLKINIRRIDIEGALTTAIQTWQSILTKDNSHREVAWMSNARFRPYSQNNEADINNNQSIHYRSGISSLKVGRNKSGLPIIAYTVTHRVNILANVLISDTGSEEISFYRIEGDPVHASRGSRTNRAGNTMYLQMSSGTISILKRGPGKSDVVIGIFSDIADNAGNWVGINHTALPGIPAENPNFGNTHHFTESFRSINPNNTVDMSNQGIPFTHLRSQLPTVSVSDELINSYLSSFTNNKDRGFASLAMPYEYPIYWYNRPYHEDNGLNDLSFGNGANTGQISAPYLDDISYEGIVQVECDDDYLYVLAEKNSGTILRADMTIIRERTENGIKGRINLSWTLIASNVNEGQFPDGATGLSLKNLRGDPDSSTRPYVFYRSRMVLYDTQIYIERDNRIVRVIPINDDTQ